MTASDRRIVVVADADSVADADADAVAVAAVEGYPNCRGYCFTPRGKSRVGGTVTRTDLRQERERERERMEISGVFWKAEEGDYEEGGSAVGRFEFRQDGVAG